MNTNAFREIFDSKNSPDKLAGQLQDYVDAIVQKCPDVDWDENFLSYQIITAIRDVLSRYIFPNTNLEKFDIEAYKLTGIAERTHGDIAIVVSNSFEGGRPVSGVGFYEAKASSLDGHYYPAFSIQQLRRLVTNTPKLSYLLYDRKAQNADTQEWSTSQERVKSPFERRSFHARTVDANFVKQYKNLEAAAFSMGQSFGYHFVNKILSGRELDYSRRPIDTIRRWLKLTRHTTSFVMSIAIREDEKQPIHAQLELPNFDKLLLQAPKIKDFHKLPSKENNISNN